MKYPCYISCHIMFNNHTHDAYVIGMLHYITLKKTFGNLGSEI